MPLWKSVIDILHDFDIPTSPLGFQQLLSSASVSASERIFYRITNLLEPLFDCFVVSIFWWPHRGDGPLELGSVCPLKHVKRSIYARLYVYNKVEVNMAKNENPHTWVPLILLVKKQNVSLVSPPYYFSVLRFDLKTQILKTKQTTPFNVVHQSSSNILELLRCPLTM